MIRLVRNESMTRGFGLEVLEELSSHGRAVDLLGPTQEEIRGALDPLVTFLSYFGTIWAAWWAGRCCQVGFCDCRCTEERAEMVPGDV